MARALKGAFSQHLFGGLAGLRHAARGTFGTLSVAKGTFAAPALAALATLEGWGGTWPELVPGGAA